MECLPCAKHFIYINSLNHDNNAVREFPFDKWRHWVSVWLYMVVNRGVRFKSKSAWLFTTLHTSLGVSSTRQGFQVSTHGLRAGVVWPPVVRLGEATSAWAHKCSPPEFMQPMQHRCASKRLATAQFRTKEVCGRKEWSGATRQVCLHIRAKQTQIWNKEPGS